jgi:hypothetical protein
MNKANEKKTTEHVRSAADVIAEREARRIEAKDTALSIRAENGEFGEGALIMNGKVIKRHVNAMDAMDHFRAGIHAETPKPSSTYIQAKLDALPPKRRAKVEKAANKIIDGIHVTHAANQLEQFKRENATLKADLKLMKTAYADVVKGHQAACRRIDELMNAIGKVFPILNNVR